MKFNFGHYLNTIMPQKRMAITREEFLSLIYDPIIEKYDVLDKNGEQYLIGRELTSNLFRCTANLPITLQKAFDKADSERNLFIESFKSAFNELYSYDVLYEYTGKLVKEIVSNKPFNKETNKKFAEELLKDDPYHIHWFLFKTLGSMENRINAPFRKQGRPSKTEKLKDFFYLSEEEKIYEFNRMINNFAKDDCNITYEQFRYFLDSLAYIDINVDKLTKEKILLNFFEIDLRDNHLSKGDNLTIYFENARDALGRREIYNEWISLIPNIAIELQIKKLKSIYKNFDENAIIVMHNEIEKNVDNDYMLKNEKFKKEFVKNKFFLPNFLGSINYNLWSYCHYIAVLASKADLKQEFVDHINLIRANNESTRTVNDRCDALIEKCQFYVNNQYF